MRLSKKSTFLQSAISDQVSVYYFDTSTTHEIKTLHDLKIVEVQKSYGLILSGA